MKLDLLTNATVVDDAIRFVSSNNGKEKLKSARYDEGKDQLDEEQEEKTEEVISSVTTNQVF